MTPAEIACMDPQQRWLLETAYEALENGMPSLLVLAGTHSHISSGDFSGEGGLLQNFGSYWMFLV